VQRRAAGITDGKPRKRGCVEWTEHRYRDDASGWLGERLAGAVVVDAWDLAHRVSVCCATYVRRLYEAGPIDQARRCDAVLVCPHCATARAGLYATSVRRVIASLTREDGRIWRELAELEALELGKPQCRLVTLTQRAIPGEPLASAIGRCLDALRTLWGSRAPPSWRELHEATGAGGRYQLEAERGWPGSHKRCAKHKRTKCRTCAPPWKARWWHVHVHMVVIADRLEEQRDGWERRWQRATERASRRWLGDESGAAHEDSRRDGRWWTPVDLEGLGEVYQATKYLAPDVSALDPGELVELLTCARYARLSGEWGSLLGSIRAAEALELAGQPDPCPPEIPRPELGAPVLIPEACPTVVEELGWRTPATSSLVLECLEDPRTADTVVGLVDELGTAPGRPESPLEWAEWVDAAAEVLAARVTAWRLELAELADAKARERLDACRGEPPSRWVSALLVASAELDEESDAHNEQLSHARQRCAHARWMVDLRELSQELEQAC